MSRSLLFAYVTGAGNPADWNGLKPFIDGVNDIDVLWGQWDNPDSLRAIASAIGQHEKAFLAGHSHGAWRAIEIADGKYGAVGKVDSLLVLDPIPPMGEGWELAGDPYVPVSVIDAQCFYGEFDPLFGKPFLIAEGDNRPIRNELVRIDHEMFPEYSRNYVGLKIQELYAA